MRHRQYKVSIKCEGKRLKEYQVEVDHEDSRRITCWIPSEAGKVSALCLKSDNTYSSTCTQTFSICFHDVEPTEYSSKAEYYADGIRIRKSIYRPGSKAELTHIPISDTLDAPMMFSNLKYSGMLISSVDLIYNGGVISPSIMLLVI